jgi:ABC-type dipeptide/oligopeptide/nickel transport system ATPase component
MSETTNILGFAGKKGSGKSTCALYVLGAYMSKLGIIEGGFCVDEDGLRITDVFGDGRFEGIFDPYRDNDTMRNFLEEYVHPYVKLYSFADTLKRFCVEVLGVDRDSFYGTNEQKNSLTHLLWEDMPGVTTNKCFMDWFERQRDISIKKNEEDEKFILTYHEPGLMTGREVMQYFGTNIIRKMYGPAWAKETLNRINNEGTLLAVVTDCRFLDEIQEIQKYGGKVVKLTRNPYPDPHISETQLDERSEDIFDAVINNEYGIESQNDSVKNLLETWQIIPEIKVIE